MATAKKTAKKKATRKPRPASLPPASDMPEGFDQIGGSYAPTWEFSEVGDSITGAVSSDIREVVFNKGTKKEQSRRVVELTTEDGTRQAVWESATLKAMFEEIAQEGPGSRYYIRYDGVGKKKPGQNPPKLFTVAKAH